MIIVELLAREISIIRNYLVAEMLKKNKHCFHYCYFSLLDIEYTDFDTHSFFTMQMMREMKKEFDD